MRLFILLSILVFLISSCGKPKDCPDDFIVYGNVEPYSDIYYVGDTLELYVKNSCEYVYSRSQEKYYSLRGHRFFSNLSIYQIDSSVTDYYYKLHEFVDIIDDTTFAYEPCYSTDSNSYLLFSSVNQNDSIYSSVKIVLKKKGLFYLSFGIWNSNVMHCGLSYVYSNYCDTVNFDLCTLLNKGKDNNINFLKESPNDRFNSWMLHPADKNFYERGGFAYKVIDKYGL